MRRREFIASFGSAAAWPVVARAQQGNRVRRIGVLMPYGEDDPEEKTAVSALTQALADLGWIDPRNVRIDLDARNRQPGTKRGFDRARCISLFETCRATRVSLLLSMITLLL